MSFIFNSSYPEGKISDAGRRFVSISLAPSSPPTMRPIWDAQTRRWKLVRR